MATYTTKSTKHSDLDGSMEMTGTTVTSYTSDAKGVGNVVANSAPSGINFTVTFRQGRAYTITASADGTGFKGRSNRDNSEQSQRQERGGPESDLSTEQMGMTGEADLLAVEDWTATASTV